MFNWTFYVGTKLLNDWSERDRSGLKNAVFVDPVDQLVPGR